MTGQETGKAIESREVLESGKGSTPWGWRWLLWARVIAALILVRGLVQTLGGTDWEEVMFLLGVPELLWFMACLLIATLPRLAFLPETRQAISIFLRFFVFQFLAWFLSLLFTTGSSQWRHIVSQRSFGIIVCAFGVYSFLKMKALIDGVVASGKVSDSGIPPSDTAKWSFRIGLSLASIVLLVLGSLGGGDFPVLTVKVETDTTLFANMTSGSWTKKFDAGYGEGYSCSLVHFDGETFPNLSPVEGSLPRNPLHSVWLFRWGSVLSWGHTVLLLLVWWFPGLLPTILQSVPLVLLLLMPFQLAEARSVPIREALGLLQGGAVALLGAFAAAFAVGGMGLWSARSPSRSDPSPLPEPFPVPGPVLSPRLTVALFAGSIFGFLFVQHLSRNPVEVLVEAARGRSLEELRTRIRDSFPVESKEFLTRALHEALRTSNDSLAEALLDCGAPIDGAGGSEGGPLYWAACWGRWKIARKLLESGADPNQKNGFFQSTCLHPMAEWRRGPESIAFAELLLGRGAKIDDTDNRGETPLAKAVTRKNLEMATWLLEKGANPNLVVKSQGGKSLLAGATQRRDTEFVELLLRFGAKPDFAESGDGEKTPLQVAAEMGNTSEARLLLDAKVDPDKAGGGAMAPILIAVKERNWGLARELVERGADLSVAGGLRRQGILHILAEDSSPYALEFIRYLRARNFVSDPEDYQGMTPLMRCIFRKDTERAAEMLMMGADPNRHFPQEQKPTPLHIAVSDGDQKLLKALLSANAKPDEPDSDGRTPLHLAVLEGATTCFQSLILFGADPEAVDSQGKTPRMLAAEKGLSDQLDAAISQGR